MDFMSRMGTRRSLDVSVCPILNEVATKARLIVATEVTQQVELQTQLEDALRQESVDKLPADVAREINSPIQLIEDNVRFVSDTLQNFVPLLDCLSQLADENLNEEEFNDLRQLMTRRFKPSKIESVLRQVPAALNDVEEGVASVAKFIARMQNRRSSSQYQTTISNVGPT